MRHKRGYRRLNRTHEHRKALFANMSGSLIEHEQIKTTLPKAKELKPKELSIFVNLYNCLLIVSGSTPLLNSITILIPATGPHLIKFEFLK